MAATTLKPVSDALQAGELYRLKGHCGGPATDYVEQVHVVVFERTLGRLRANSFSYSGNPQGCDHTVRHLHAALDGLQDEAQPPVANATGRGLPRTGCPLASHPATSNPAARVGKRSDDLPLAGPLTFSWSGAGPVRESGDPSGSSDGTTLE